MITMVVMDETAMEIVEIILLGSRLYLSQGHGIDGTGDLEVGQVSSNKSR